MASQSSDNQPLPWALPNEQDSLLHLQAYLTDARNYRRPLKAPVTAIGIIISEHIKRDEQKDNKITNLAKQVEALKKQIEKRDKLIENLEKENEIAKRDNATEKLKAEKEIEKRDKTIKKLEKKVAGVQKSCHKITTALSYRYLLERFPEGVRKWTKPEREEVGWEAFVERIKGIQNAGKNGNVEAASLELVKCDLPVLEGLYNLLSEEIHKFRSRSGFDFDKSQ
ncbi:hypothetical protein B0T19DRAFT_436144 [Cercophora scortea]|uniref:Uncharacterized protein n=1 Tax=Cercophora scortea TaxID=314031 RepID=A0AAE0J2D6_9PEZI|nr:hypothetical protein B0T19DRAFT_436144 [Cercophora scortea]